MSNASFFFGTLCPILGTVISTLQHSVGILVVRICRRNGSLGVANPVPWSVSLVCCITWVVYGVMIRDFKRCVLLGSSDVPVAMLSEIMNAAPNKLCYIHLAHAGGRAERTGDET